MIPGLSARTGIIAEPVLTTFVAGSVNNSNSETLVIDKPTGVVSGDMLIAVVASQSNVTWTGDSGWTELADQGAAPSLRLARKTAGGSEPASYTFTASGGLKTSGAILAYRAGTFDAVGSFNTANPVVAPSITMSYAGILLAAYASENASVTFTTPGGMAALASYNVTAPSFAVFDQEVGGGATGTRTSTPSGGTVQAGILIGIKSV